MDTGYLSNESVGPYIANAESTISQGQEKRWLLEYSNSTKVQILFSTEDEAELQFSVFASEGTLLWSVDSLSPANESFRIEPDCSGFCSFVAKAFVHSSSNDVFVNVRILAETSEDVLLSALP